MDEQAPSPLQAIYFREFSNSYIPQILKEIYIDRIYQPFLIGKRDATIVDFGANIGLTSYYFKDFAKKVYAVEPAKQHTEVITHMLKQNKIDNVKLCPYAISNTNGKTKFYHNTNTTMFSLKDAVNDKSDFEEVETVTVDSFMKREGIETIDFMKFDLEGAESEVLSSEGFRLSAPNIKTIVMEWHTWTAQSLPNTIHLLTDLGYEVRRIPSEATILSAVRV